MISASTPFKDPVLMAGRLAFIALLAILLSACAGKSVIRKLDHANQIPLSQINHWQLNARVAIKTPKDSITASLNWQNNQTDFDFLLSGAFGVTYAHLIQNGESASLEVPDTDKLYHHNAEKLLNEALGWEFPIKALSYWVKGLPSGQSGEITHYSSEGLLTHVELNQWQISFSKYRLYQGVKLPKMIKASHPDLNLKVVAKKWQFFESFP